MSENKVTKKDIADQIIENSGLERKEIGIVIDSFLEEIKNALKNGKTIELRGFGTFEPCLRKGHKKARNPRTGETVTGVPHYVAKFRAGQNLKNDMLEIKINE